VCVTELTMARHSFPLIYWLDHSAINILLGITICKVKLYLLKAKCGVYSIIYLNKYNSLEFIGKNLLNNYIRYLTTGCTYSECGVMYCLGQMQQTLTL